MASADRARFLQGLPLGDEARQRRARHHVAAFFRRLEEDGVAVLVRSQYSPHGVDLCFTPRVAIPIVMSNLSRPFLAECFARGLGRQILQTLGLLGVALFLVIVFTPLLHFLARGSSARTRRDRAGG